MDSKYSRSDIKKSKITYNPFTTGPLLKAVPTTEAQREIWLTIGMDENATLCFNESLAIELNGSLNFNAFKIAFQHLLLKHDSLRSVFSVDGKTFYVKEFVPDNLIFLDYTAKNAEDMEALKKAEVEFKYDLINGPCFRATLIKKATDQYSFLFSAHHIICDGWSIAILLQELSEFYNDILRDKIPQSLGSDQYSDFAIEQYIQGPNLEHKKYWLKEFEKPLRVNPFPIEHKRPAFRSFNSARYDVTVTSELASAIKNLGVKEGCSLYNTLMSILNIFLFNLTKSDDILVGMALAPQSSLGRSNLVGHMVNILPLKINFNKNSPFNEFIKSVKTKMLDAIDHQYYSYGALVKDLKIVDRISSEMPLFNIVFNIDQQSPDQGLKFVGIKATYRTIPRVFENFEIFINLVSNGETLVFECQYNTNLFTSSLIENWFSAFFDLIKQVISSPTQNVKSFCVKDLYIPVLGQIEEKVAGSTTAEELERNPQIEEKIRKIWSKVLLNKSLHVHDNFFSIGGHSLLAMEVASLLQIEFKSNFTIKDIFENPTIIALSHEVSKRENNSQKILPALMPHSLASVEVSNNQMQVWYLEERHPQTIMHNLPTSIRIKSNINRLALEKTLHLIIERHPSLRTAIMIKNGAPVQEILDINLPIFKPHLELIKTTEDKILDFLNTEAHFCFDKTRPPLLRAKLYELGADDYVFFFMVHHAVWDGWSFDIFFDELNTIYSAFAKNEIPSLMKKSEITYADYSLWIQNLLSEKLLNKQIKYWEEKLKGPLPILDLPLDYKRPMKISHEGSTYPFVLSSEQSLALRNYAKGNNTSLFNVFLTAFKVTLARYSSGSDIIVGLPVRGRNKPEVMNVIGYFVNTIALRSQIILDQSFEENLKHVSSTCAEALENQLVPFQIILNKIDYAKDSSRTPIFQTFFSYQDVTNRNAILNGTPYTQINIDRASVHTDLDLWIKTSDRRIEGAFEYRKDLFKDITIERFEQCFFNTLDSLVENKNKPLNAIRSIPLILEEQIMLTWNDTWKSTEDFVPFFKIFEQNVLKNPDAFAVETNQESVTYRELDCLAKRCANALLDKGVKRGQLVGISLERDVGLLAAILGVLKTGAGYVPLDPGFPQERLDYMIQSSAPILLITENLLADRFSDQIEKLILSNILSDIRFDKDIPKFSHELTDTIYVIYTSGSTGNPKGVQLTHGSVTNFLLSMKEKIQVEASDKILAVTTLSFDIAVLELFLPLISGGTVYLSSSIEAMDGSLMKGVLESKDITIMQATPSTWRLLLASGWKGSKKVKVICGGEAFPIDLAQSLIPICHEVWNMYGPTETTVWSACKKLKIDDECITIGRPVANTSLYVLNENRLMKPIGSTGELFIGGFGLARGYFGRDDLTSERFLPDPFNPGGRMYATGDLARFTYDGEVECLGRNDGQVKVRGYRIELGEIEAELQKIPDINIAAVLTNEYRPGDVRICAYFSTLSGASIDERLLRENLNKKLPSYMIPSHFTHLEKIPLTLNGKIDKNSLLKVQTHNVVLAAPKVETVKPQNEKEIKEKLRLLWIEVLGITELKDSDNYFNIGGNSLLAVELLTRISSDFKISLPLSSLIAADDFESFVKFFEEKNKALDISNFSEDVNNESHSLPQQFFKSLVTIKSKGSKNPIFCFHGVGGNILNYVSLIPATKNERPLMALQSVGLDGVTPPLTTISEMAKSYIREIRLVQPVGPYLLAGGSMGGMVAFEVALQLIRSGETIDKIIMFDTFGPNLNLKSNHTKNSSSYLLKIKDAFAIRKKYWTNMILSKIYRTLGLPVPLSILLVEIERKNYQAIWSYYPSEGLSSDLHLIRSDDKSTGWYRDPALGWSGVVNGKINTYEISGTHADFIESAELVNVLKKLI